MRAGSPSTTPITIHSLFDFLPVRNPLTIRPRLLPTAPLSQEKIIAVEDKPEKEISLVQLRFQGRRPSEDGITDVTWQLKYMVTSGKKS
jgi:hypothetical protein